MKLTHVKPTCDVICSHFHPGWFLLLFVLWLHFTKLIVMCVILSDHELGLGPDFEYGHRERIILYPLS